jgi:hypothetical protein
VQPDEADDVPVRRVGLPVQRRRNDPCRGAPSTFGASSPPLTSSCRAMASSSNGARTKSLALQLAEAEPLRARGEARAAAARNELWRRQGSVRPEARGRGSGC